MVEWTRKTGGCFAAREKCVPFLGGNLKIVESTRLIYYEACLLEARGKKDRQDISITRPWSKHGKNVVVSRSEVKRTMSLHTILYELDVCIYIYMTTDHLGLQHETFH